MYQGQKVRTNYNGLIGMAGEVLKPGDTHTEVLFKPAEDVSFARTLRNEYLIPIKPRTIFDEAREAIDHLEQQSKREPRYIHVEIGRNVYIAKTWLPKKEL